MNEKIQTLGEMENDFPNVFKNTLPTAQEDAMALAKRELAWAEKIDDDFEIQEEEEYYDEE